MRNRLFIALSLTILAFFVVINSACVSPQAAEHSAQAEPAVIVPVETGADAEIKEAENLAQKFPAEAQSFVRLAAAHLKKVRESGDGAFSIEADKAIKRALEIEPENSPAHICRAQIFLSQHKFAEAAGAVKKQLKSNPRNPALLLILTDAQFGAGNYKEAARLAQKAFDIRSDAASYTRMANVRSLNGDVESAIEARKQAIGLADPQDKLGLAELRTKLGIEYWNVGKYTHAESEFDAALTALPDYYYALAGKGKVRAGQGDLETAVKVFEKLNARLEYADFKIALGDLYKAIGRNEAAQKTYEEAVRRERESGGGNMHRIAQFWADHDTNLDEALDIARQERDKSGDISARDTYAWCLFKKGRVAEAEKAMEETLQYDTRNSLYYFHMGMIQNALGNRLQALKYLKLAVQTNPAFDVLQSRNAKQALSELEQDGNGS